MLIPKYHHSKKYDVIKYAVRPVGFWRRFTPFRFFPYSTGDVIWIHIKIRRTEEEWWQQGNLCIDPPEQFDEPFMGRITSSDFPFKIEEIQKGRTWSRTLALKGGTDFKVPCQIVCYLELKKVGDKTSTDTIKIANIAVVWGWLVMSTIIFIALALLAITTQIGLRVFDP